MSQVTAWAPANISCIFKIHEHKNPSKMGSSGVGFTLDKGVHVTIKKATKPKTTITFNNEVIQFPTITQVITLLPSVTIPLNIKIVSELPLSCGFGISGASALATTLALNKLCNVGLTNKQCAQIAHIAEVKQKTGLGDVINQYTGGLCIKYESSANFQCEQISLNLPIYYTIIDKLNTKDIISDKQIIHKINLAGENALNEIASLSFNKNTSQNKILKHIIDISYRFANQSTLLKNKSVQNTIESINRNEGSASMIMLGNAVFSNKNFKNAQKANISTKAAHVTQ